MVVLGGTVPGAAALPRIARSLLPGPTGPSLTITPGREFAANSYVYRPLAPNAKLDPKSRAYVASLVRQIKHYYGHADVNVGEYTPSIFIVSKDRPTVRVKAVDWSDPNWTYPRLQARWDAVPLPDRFAPAQGTDQEAVVYQPSTHRMWEFWLMRKTGAKIKNSAGRLVDEWGARWGGRMDNIQRNPGYWITTPQGDTFGTTAVGIPFLAGMLTVQEQQRGVINHVLGVAVPDIAFGRCSFPAQRCAPTSHSPDAIPEGTMFRLPAALNLDAMHMDPYARMLAKAVQRHGMVVWDSAGAVGFRAENPTINYARNPYYSPGGIFRCPAGTNPSDPPSECWSYNRLRGFPWSKLQVLKPTHPGPVSAGSAAGRRFVMGARTYSLDDSGRPPVKGVVVRDSLFGTEIVRVTDKSVDHYPDVGIANEYARSDPENSDGTLLVLRGNAANWQLYNAVTFKRIRTMTALGRGGQEPEPRWDPKDPSVVFHLRNMRLLSLNVMTGAERTVHDFQRDFPRLSYISTGTEGDSSLDRRWWCFRVQDRDYATKALVMYDRQRNQIVGRIAVTRVIDNVSADASGEHCVVQYDDGDTTSYTRTLSRGVQLPAGSVGHSDIARTAPGADVLVYQDVKTDWISVANLATGKVTRLLHIPFEVNPAIGMHVSGNAAVAPGWVLVSTSGPLNPPAGSRHSWMDRQLFMLELRPHPRVWRVAQTHTLESINPDDQKHYFAEAFAAITTRGTRIYWGSNWGQKNLEHTDVYAAILPRHWWQQLPSAGA